MKHSRRPARLLLELALCAALAVLAGCGGDSEPSTSTRAAANPDGGQEEPAAKGGKESGAKPRPTPGEKREQPSSKAGAGSPQKHEPDDAGGTHQTAARGHTGKGATAKDNPTRPETNDCPRGTSNRDCAKLKAVQQSNPKSEVRAVDECPAAMSSDECAAAGKSFEEAQAGGHVASPNECPRAMTAEQCAEAGKAYEEANR